VKRVKLQQGESEGETSKKKGAFTGKKGVPHKHPYVLVTGVTFGAMKHPGRSDEGDISRGHRGNCWGEK